MALFASALLISASARADLPSPNPIRHVVIVYQENHSFDNVFGRLCTRTGSCDGATEGTLPDGSTIHRQALRFTGVRWWGGG